MAVTYQYSRKGWDNTYAPYGWRNISLRHYGYSNMAFYGCAVKSYTWNMVTKNGDHVSIKPLYGPSRKYHYDMGDLEEYVPNEKYDATCNMIFEHDILCLRYLTS